MKVGHFNGVVAEDIFYNLVQLMRTTLSALMLHVGTNNTDRSNLSKVISQPIQRTDNDKATIALNNLNKLWIELNVNTIDNSAIDVSSLRKH